jgi:hypothetical protein
LRELPRFALERADGRNPELALPSSGFVRRRVPVRRPSDGLQAAFNLRCEGPTLSTDLANRHFLIMRFASDQAAVSRELRLEHGHRQRRLLRVVKTANARFPKSCVVEHRVDDPIRGWIGESAPARSSTSASSCRRGTAWRAVSSAFPPASAWLLRSVLMTYSTKRNGSR